MTIKNTNEEFSSDAESQKPGKPENDFETAGEGNDSSLQALLRDQEAHVRERLREGLGREPSQEEVDAWLNEHTESY